MMVHHLRYFGYMYPPLAWVSYLFQCVLRCHEKAINNTYYMFVDMMRCAKHGCALVCNVCA